MSIVHIMIIHIYSHPEIAYNLEKKKPEHARLIMMKLWSKKDFLYT